MSDTQNEVQFLTEELEKARERLAHADEHYRSLAAIYVQNEVQFLTEELNKTRERLAHADEHYRSLATLCEGYHAILFGDHRIPPKDPELVMRAIAYSFAFCMAKNGVKNFMTQDIPVSNVPGYTQDCLMNVTVQRVEGKSTLQVLREKEFAMEAMVTAITALSPELAETIALSRHDEIPEVVAKWMKTHAIAANPTQSTPST